MEELSVLVDDGDRVVDVGAVLVGVEGDCLPPVRDGGRGGDLTIGGED